MVFMEKWIDTIVPVKKAFGIILLILNIFVPGVGTLINAVMGAGIDLWGLATGGL